MPSTYPVGQIRCIAVSPQGKPETPSPGILRIVGAVWVRIPPHLTYDSDRHQFPIRAQVYPVTNVASARVMSREAATGWYMAAPELPYSTGPRVTMVTWPTDDEVNAILASLHLEE